MKLKAETRNKCQNCPAFRDSYLSVLSEPQLIKLRENSIAFSFKRGQNINLRNTDCSGMYCIGSGVVKMHLDEADNEGFTLGLRKPGSMLGHYELMERENIFSTTCLTDVKACFFPKPAMQTLFDHSSSFRNRLHSGIHEDFTELRNMLLSIIHKSIRKRTVSAIFYLKEKLGVDEWGTIALPITIQEFSYLVGASRESVHRELAFLKNQKMIEVKKQTIRIIDQEKLVLLYE